jgi:hypothetical protein
MSAAIAGMINEPTAKPARDNFLIMVTILVGNESVCDSSPPVVTRWSHCPKNKGLPEDDRQRVATEAGPIKSPAAGP